MANEDSEYTTESDTSSDDEAQIRPLSQSTVQGMVFDFFGTFGFFLNFVQLWVMIYDI